VFDQQTLNTIGGIIVIVLTGIAVYDYGRKSGEAGILKGLQTIQANKPALDATEGLLQSVPGDVAERLIAKAIDAYVSLRPFVPTEMLKQIGDTAAAIGREVSDGKPNDLPPLGPPPPDPAFTATIHDGNG
jgi:hypothetical protein